jgi:hypothetical protein
MMIIYANFREIPLTKLVSTKLKTKIKFYY